MLVTSDHIDPSPEFEQMMRDLFGVKWTERHTIERLAKVRLEFKILEIPLDPPNRYR